MMIFYCIEDAFDKATIKKLRKYFKHRDCWQRLGQGATTRDEGHYTKVIELQRSQVLYGRPKTSH